MNTDFMDSCLDHGCLGKLDPSEEVKQRFASFLPNSSLLEKEIAAAGEERCYSVSLPRNKN